MEREEVGDRSFLSENSPYLTEKTLCKEVGTIQSQSIWRIAKIVVPTQAKSGG